MKITVRLFARLREQAGGGCHLLEIASPATLADVYQTLRDLHPGLEVEAGRVRAVRNLEMADWDELVSDGDEVAFLPPVSGGAQSSVSVELTSDPLDVRRLESAVAHPGAGAICSFTGTVRDSAGGEAVTHLEYEAYAALAERQINEIAVEMTARWPGLKVAMAHRVGTVLPGEVSVVVSVSCPHRQEAFAACRYGIDRIKESAAIWKKEFTRSNAHWA
jgi:MoaE-MoaD fusion protein